MKNVCGKNIWWIMHIFTFSSYNALGILLLSHFIKFSSTFLKSKDLWRATNEVTFNYLIYAKDVNYTLQRL